MLRDRFHQFFSTCVSSLSRLQTLSKRSLVITGLLVLALPVITLFALQQTQLGSHAAEPNKSEAENGINQTGQIYIGDNDPSASGGKYIQFGGNPPANPPANNPTTAPISSTPLSLGNKFGIGVLSMLTSEQNQWQWSKQLVGSGGFLKFVWSDITPGTSGPPSEMVNAVNWAYQNNLVPVVRIDGYWSDKNRCGQGLTFTCEQLADKMKTVVSGLPRKNGVPLWIEIVNENDYDRNWGGHASGSEYGRLLLLAANAIHSLGDDRIKVMNGGLGPDWGFQFNTGVKTTQFIKDMFNNNPELKTGNNGKPVIDAWASHPYPDNSAPNINYHSGTAPGGTAAYDSYIPELQTLASLGVNLPVMITETGYSSNRFSRDALAGYTVQAMQYWNSDSRVVGVLFFVMSNFPAGTAAHNANFFPDFYFVPYESGTNADGTPTNPYPVYTAVRNYRSSTGK